MSRVGVGGTRVVFGGREQRSGVRVGRLLGRAVRLFGDDAFSF